MASPQLEDGFTRIANELLEALIRTDLNGAELRIVLWAVRQTYGWNRKDASLTAYAAARAAGIPPTSAKRALRSLKSKGLIGDRSLVKDYDRWTMGPKMARAENGPVQKRTHNGATNGPISRRPKERKDIGTSSLGALVETYFKMRPEAPRDLAGRQAFFKRNARPAKELLAACGGDLPKAQGALKAAQEAHEGRGLSWGLEAALKFHLDPGRLGTSKLKTAASNPYAGLARRPLIAVNGETR